MKDYLVDALLDKTTKEQEQKRKANRKHKLAVEHIKCWLACGNIKKAIDIAELHGITAKEFGKIAATV